jgi:hypothetical protein
MSFHATYQGFLECLTLAKRLSRRRSSNRRIVRTFINKFAGFTAQIDAKLFPSARSRAAVQSNPVRKRENKTEREEGSEGARWCGREAEIER